MINAGINGNRAIINGRALLEEGIETLERYATGNLTTGQSYTPADSGIFFEPQMGGENGYSCEYYSTANTKWQNVTGLDDIHQIGFTAIGDGTNFRIKMQAAPDGEYCLFRHYYSKGTYERESDQQLADGASYTPSDDGFFASATEHATCDMQSNYAVAGWGDCEETLPDNSRPATIVLGDGTNLRVRNDAGAAKYAVLMRAEMT